MSEQPTPFDRALAIMDLEHDTLRLRRRLYRYCILNYLTPQLAEQVASGQVGHNGIPGVSHINGLSTRETNKINAILDRITTNQQRIHELASQPRS